MADPLCPKCRRTILGIKRHYGGKKKLVEVEVHHREDQALAADGVASSACVIKMTFRDCETLANSVSSDLGNRK